MDLSNITAAAKKQAARPKKSSNAKGMQGLTAEDIKTAKTYFNTFDRDGNKTICDWELRLAMTAMGCCVTDEEVEKLMMVLDSDANKKLDFPEFLKAVQMQKENEKKNDAEQDLIDAFVAMGGNADKTGVISAERLRKVIKDDYGLNIKIDEQIEELDTNNDGTVGYEEFAKLLA